MSEAPTRRGIVPGFGLSLGLTLTYLSFVVLLPLAALLVRAGAVGPQGLLRAVTSARALAAFRLSFGTALLAGLIDAIAGSVVAWTLVRYRFPGRRLFEALVDLPFALPTAVSGIALATLFGPHGWLGALLLPLGIRENITINNLASVSRMGLITGVSGTWAAVACTSSTSRYTHERPFSAASSGWSAARLAQVWIMTSSGPRFRMAKTRPLSAVPSEPGGSS